MADEAQKELDEAPASIQKHPRMLNARNYLEAERDNDKRGAEEFSLRAERIWQSLRPWECDLRLSDNDGLGDWNTAKGVTLSITQNGSKYDLRIVESDHIISASIDSFAGFSEHNSSRETREKNSLSMLGALAFSRDVGVLFICAKAKSVSVVYSNKSNFIPFEFTKTPF